MRPPGGQRWEPAVATPVEVAAQVGLGVGPGLTLVAGEVGGYCKSEHLLGVAGIRRLEMHDVHAATAPLTNPEIKWQRDEQIAA